MGPRAMTGHLGTSRQITVSSVRQTLLSRRRWMQFIIEFRCLLPNHASISWYISAPPTRAIEADSNRNILDHYFLRSSLLIFFSCASQRWRMHLPESLKLLRSPSLYKTQGDFSAAVTQLPCNAKIHDNLTWHQLSGLKGFSWISNVYQRKYRYRILQHRPLPPYFCYFSVHST